MTGTIIRIVLVFALVSYLQWRVERAEQAQKRAERERNYWKARAEMLEKLCHIYMAELYQREKDS